VENSTLETLQRGLEALALELPPGGPERLLAYSAELLKWNEKVNLTAITRTEEVLDKHLLDSLAVAPELAGAGHLLDLGAGAGFPGIPLAVALPSLRATLVDAVAKKVAFMKVGVVKAELTGRVRALHARAAGQPAKEGLPTVDLVISRAFMDVGPFLSLAVHYLEPAGKVVCMLGQAPPAAELERLALSTGLRLASLRRFNLPLSGDPRAVAVFAR
jgi:16S rRNA (guanine527-N7)-methyltransferase